MRKMNNQTADLSPSLRMPMRKAAYFAMGCLLLGFASGCQAFGHRELLGQLRSFGLVMNPILTVHS